MKNRYLDEPIKNLALKRHKMAFISGPRQVGKTTLSKFFLKDNKNYFNWDAHEFRRVWAKAPSSLIEVQKNKNPIVVFDEIHKAAKWKGTLKGIYDQHGNKCRIIVTGSARLNVYKRGGDSLMGRYLNFRLHGFSVGELSAEQPCLPQDLIKVLLKKKITHRKKDHNSFLRLLKFGGFPEPYLTKSEKISRLWRQGRVEKIVREDLRDLSRLPELSKIEMTMSLMPARAGNMLSIQSLREDLEVSYDTMKSWLKYLSYLYYHFEVKPWSKNIPRSMKKEGKLYLWDWSEIETSGERYENLIASHLLKACHYYTDTGEGKSELYYLRNKEKQEVDFLISLEGKPWLVIEAKLTDTTLSNNFKAFLKYTKPKFFLQLVKKPNVFERAVIDNIPGMVVSASAFLRYLP